MSVPVVAIVGRPNVGKSSLFNWLAGRRIAIVDPTAGVTRDRLTTRIKDDACPFELVDTGGMGIQDVDNLTAQVEAQIQLAIEQAELILFLVDARSGIAPLDEEVAGRLRAAGKPVLCVANKCDTLEMEPQAADFFRLGWGKPICVSALQNRGKADLLKQIDKLLPRPERGGRKPAASSAGEGDPENDAPADGSRKRPSGRRQQLEPMKLAIVGRRNTGKSTFINCLAQSERMIVSEVAGTTRDSVDVHFERDGKAFIAIDTAGVRRKGSIASDIEFYSIARAERSIRRADVVLLFFDPRLKISKVDKQLADYVLTQHKPAIFVVNKWDLAVGKMATGQLGDYFRAIFPMLDYVPIAFITAKDGKNVQMVLNLAQTIFKQACARVGTGDLNRVLREALEHQAPPLSHNRRPKVYYATQVSAQPPTIVLFTNGPQLFDKTYQRYLIKMFRDHLPFNDVPIKLYLRAKNREEADDAPEQVEQPPAREKRKAPERKTRKPAGKKARGGEPELWKDL